MRTSLRSLALSSVLVALALAGAPTRAAACGGFFCNATQPVVQSGEQIVYAIEDDGSLVMTVRIAYQGDAPEFAWLLPVPVVPTIALGSNAMFDALDASTSPLFTRVDRTDGTCARPPACAYPDSGYRFSDAAAASDAGAPGPTIYLDEQLGPYETVVIGAGSGSAVYDWLTLHGYVIAPSATPILDDYLGSGHVVVALRLRTSASTSEIQPVRLTMPGTPPCLPIRLTAIATQPDLPITAYFLAAHRVVPSNYSMVDDAGYDLGLWTGTTSYAAWATRAIDALGGRAFTTDYAGASPMIGIALPSVTDLATETDPAAFLRELRGRGYAGDAQLLALLTRFVVPPAGEAPRDFYNCLFGFGLCAAPVSYDPAALAAAIDQTITQPRAADQAMVAAHATTTRLFTTMSAEEMTLDPEFRVDDALPGVARERVATFVRRCDATHFEEEAAITAVLPDGTMAPVQAAQPHVTDARYCAVRGGYLPGTTPGVDSGLASAPDAAHDDRVPTGGGSTCSVTTARGSASLVSAALIVAACLLARRRSFAAARRGVHNAA